MIFSHHITEVFMPRKRKSNDTPSTDKTNVMSDSPTTETPTAVAEPPPSPPAAAAAEPQAGEKAEGRSFAERVGRKESWKPTPDPFPVASDRLAGVRLYVSEQDGQVAIKFGDGSPADKPSEDVIDKMRQAGFDFDWDHRIWRHRFDDETRRQVGIKGEQLYQQVRQMIREERGIAPGQEMPF
jgi:hypothetical protein